MSACGACSMRREPPRHADLDIDRTFDRFVRCPSIGSLAALARKILAERTSAQIPIKPSIRQTAALLSLANGKSPRGVFSALGNYSGIRVELIARVDPGVP